MDVTIGMICWVDLAARVWLPVNGITFVFKPLSWCTVPWARTRSNEIWVMFGVLIFQIVLPNNTPQVPTTHGTIRVTSTYVCNIRGSWFTGSLWLEIGCLAFSYVWDWAVGHDHHRPIIFWSCTEGVSGVRRVLCLEKHFLARSHQMVFRRLDGVRPIFCLKYQKSKNM